MENFASLREAHNAVAAQSKKSIMEEYHFASYVPHSGKVYEIDGLNPGPYLTTAFEEGKDWLFAARNEIVSKMKMLTESRSTFHLLAVVPDRKEQLETSMKRDKAIKGEIERILNLPIEPELDAKEREKYKDILEKLPDDKTALQSMHTIVKANIMKTENEIKAEEERRKRTYQDCMKRTHDYMPFLFEMLDALNKHGILSSATSPIKK